MVSNSGSDNVPLVPTCNSRASLLHNSDIYWMMSFSIFMFLSLDYSSLVLRNCTTKPFHLSEDSEWCCIASCPDDDDF